MCTAIVSFEPDSPFPVLLVGVRDELLARPWVRPDRHWPDRPQLIGGKDLSAGGSWLAVATDVPRAACVVNGFGQEAGADRLSRGELPLILAAEGELQYVEPARFDPFHLIGAEPHRVRLWSWDGAELRERPVQPGLHFVVNTGLEGADVNDFAPDRAAEDMAARLAHFRPRLLAAVRPQPGAGETVPAWSSWLPLVDGDGLDRDDPRAMILRRDIGAGSLWGTSSISLVALRRDGVRYDFTDTPGTGGWRTIVS